MTIILLFLCLACDRYAVVFASDLGLKPLVSALPAYHPAAGIPANSEWVNPLLLQRPPGRQNGMELPNTLERELPQVLARLRLVAKLKSGQYQVEIYPVRGEGDRWQWYLPRYRSLQSAQDPWRWSPDVTVIDPWHNDQHWQKVFGPMETLGLYDKPLYSQCLFSTREAPMQLLRLWDWQEDYRAINKIGESLRQQWQASRPLCRQLLPPPMVGGVYESLTLLVTIKTKARISWHWQEAPSFVSETPIRSSQQEKLQASSWTGPWQHEYEQQIKICAGEQRASLPHGQSLFFTRKNCFQSDHQLRQMVEYLEAYYAQLGIETERQTFMWQGIEQHNLIAKLIPTDSHEEQARSPIILADHYDTAFSENVWERERLRQSNPGADDNCSATAGLMISAKQLAGLRHKLTRPIWFVHLTGEEFPADDLGARQLIRWMMARNITPAAILVMDMIAYAKSRQDRQIFQISVGSGAKARQLAAVAAGLSQQLGRREKFKARAVVRARFDDRSFLHQTDAVIFSDYGYPVLLFNEFLNMRDNWSRDHYHQSTDSTATLTMDYAAEILQTAAQIAGHLATTPIKMDHP